MMAEQQAQAEAEMAEDIEGISEAIEAQQEMMEDDMEQMSDEMLDMLADAMEDMIEDTLGDLADSMLAVTDYEMNEDEFKTLKLKHRASEDTSKLEADAKYGKAMLFM